MSNFAPLILGVLLVLFVLLVLLLIVGLVFLGIFLMKRVKGNALPEKAEKNISVEGTDLSE